MGVSENRGVSPQIINFNRVFGLFSPSILGYPYFWKHTYEWLQLSEFLAPNHCLTAGGGNGGGPRHSSSGPEGW